MEGNYKVYMHITPSGKRYIGITSQKVSQRWGAKGNRYKDNEHFVNAIKKYKWENIEHVILFTGLTKEQAEQKEIELIKQYKSNNKKYGYNIQNGGNCCGTLSDETKRKISESNKGKKKSTSGWLGRHHSPETCEKLRELETQRWLDPEYRANQVKKRLGKTAWNKGKKTPLETREKQRIAKLGKYIGNKHWNAKKIINLDTGEIYESIGLAAKHFNVANGSHIVAVCKGQRNIAYGYRWAYFEGG